MNKSVQSTCTSPLRVDFTAGIMLLALAAVWGGSFFFAEVALREVAPLTLTFFRVSGAVPLLLLVVLWRRVEVPRHVSTWLAYLIMGALNNAIPFTLIFWGQLQLTSGLASILNTTTAVVGVIVSGLLLVDERLTANKLIGAGLGLFGVAVIMGVEALYQFDLQNLAQLAILGAAFSYSFAGAWGKLRLSNIAPEMNALGMLMGSSLLMLPLAIVVEGVPSLALSFPVMGALAGVSIFSTAIAYLLYFAILGRAGSANLMLVTLLIPPFAIGLGSVFLEEVLSTNAWIGFGVIACALLVCDGRILERFR